MKNSPANKEGTSFIETFVIDLARGMVGTMELLVQESRERERAIRERSRRHAVRLIERAIRTHRRISRDRLAKYVRNAHLSIPDFADELRIPPTQLKKALKRWYHFF
jgi:predicted HTH domain antitoxin